MYTRNVVYHTSSFSFADTEESSPFSNARMTPISGTSQQPATQCIMTPHPHGGSYEHFDRGQNWRHVTIAMLPDNTLLEIFDFYRSDAIKSSRGSPWKWHRLAHVCQRWRDVVYASPRRLGLQILCKSGASIERILGAWPTLPLVVRFKGTQISRSLPKNIITALRHSSRVCEIDLSVTNPIIESMAELVHGPFLILKRIQILSKDTKEPPALGEFLGGSSPLLEEVKLDGIAITFPVMQRFLLSSNHLVKLHLDNIPNTCYFPPDILVTCLSASGQLRNLSVGFRSPASRPTPSQAPPPLPYRATFPSLDTFGFHGPSEYLEGFIARIDTPTLTFLWIKFFNQLIFEIPQLSEFVSRVDGLRLISEVRVWPARTYGSVLLSPNGVHQHQCGCYIRFPCSQLDWQLSFLTQILNQLSPLLHSARALTITKSTFPPTGKEDVDSTQWLELFQLFSHVEEIGIDIKELVPDVVHALVSEDTATGLLPSMTSLYLKGYHKYRSLTEATERFVAARNEAGQNVSLRG